MSYGVTVKAHKGEPGLWNLQQVDNTDLMREHLRIPLLNSLECKIKRHAPRFACSPPGQFLTCDSSQGEKPAHNASLKSRVGNFVTDWPECYALRTAERPLLWKEISLNGFCKFGTLQSLLCSGPTKAQETVPSRCTSDEV